MEAPMRPAEPRSFDDHEIDLRDPGQVAGQTEINRATRR
jgi:hypothetical protein